MIKNVLPVKRILRNLVADALAVLTLAALFLACWCR
jgi:hypothetical protein